MVYFQILAIVNIIAMNIGPLILFKIELGGGVEEIIQWVEHFHCMQHTWVKSLAFNMVPPGLARSASCL